MTVQENVALAPFTTFRVGGPARYFVEAGDELDVQEAFKKAKSDDLPFEVIGGGSNLLVPDAGYNGLIVHMQQRGVERDGDVFDVAAGGVVGRVGGPDDRSRVRGHGVPGGHPRDGRGVVGAEHRGVRAGGRADNRVSAGLGSFNGVVCGVERRGVWLSVPAQHL